MKKDIFTYSHPLVIFLYFAAVISFSMLTNHPIYIAVSFLISSFYLIYFKGIRNYLKSICYSLPILLIITIINPLFNGQGLTVLFYFKETPITLEAIYYGICSGGTLINVIQWFLCYSEIMSSEKFLSLFSGIFPTLSMMISMIFRYIPETIIKAREINTAQKALIPKAEKTGKERLSDSVRMTSILMSWSMESGIETADSMRARGYGIGKRSKSNIWFTSYDIVILLLLFGLIILNGILLFSVVNKFMFYPKLSNFIIPFWIPVLYAVFLLVPIIVKRIFY